MVMELMVLYNKTRVNLKKKVEMRTNVCIRDLDKLCWFGLGSSQFQVMTNLPKILLLTLEVVEIGAKIIISLLLPRFGLNL